MSPLRRKHIVAVSGTPCLYVRYACSAQGYVNRSQAMTTAMHYVGLCESLQHAEWFETMHVGRLAEQFSCGRLRVPGHSKIAEEAPPEHMETSPARPTLKVMTWKDGEKPSDAVACIPQSIVSEWALHPTYGDAIQKLMVEIEEVHAAAAGGAAGPGAKNKRGLANAQGPATPVKKPRIEECVDISELQGAELAQATLSITFITVLFPMGSEQRR